MSGGFSGRGCEFRLGSPSVCAMASKSAWRMGSVSAIIEDRRAITLDSLSRFLSKIDEMVATIGDCGPYSSWCPPIVKIGTFMEIF